MKFRISIRPGAPEFLKKMSKLFDISIFTASHQ
jgi:TFIIF-interacting CTD phosphatase-like protein